MERINLQKNSDAGLNNKEIIHKFLSQFLDKNDLAMVVVEESTKLPSPGVSICVFMACTQIEINKLISFPKEYVSYKKYYKAIDGFSTHNKFEIYNIEYFDNDENVFFKNDIKFIVIKKSPKDFAYSECAKRILVAEYNLNKAKYAIDNIGKMF